MKRTLLGPHGALLGHLPERAALSYAAQPGQSLAAWRRRARAALAERLCLPGVAPSPAAVRVERTGMFDGLRVEELSWAMPWGPRTRAVFVAPAAASGPLPAVLALHDHSGFRAMGYEKIAAVRRRVHPRLRRHYAECYEGRAWVTELAKRGFAVLAHDGFLFGSRRVASQALPGAVDRLGRAPVPRSSATIDAYNRWSSQYENVIARSIFSVGLTLPGICLLEDRMALDVLAARRDVQAERIGCCGLSGGGRRSLLLAGMDDRIAASVTVGFMSTWRDFAARRSYTHSWELYVPGLPRLLDVPDILTLRMPAPTLVQSLRGDRLFSPAEMRRAHRALRDAFRLAGATQALTARFYPGRHRFSIAMQDDAFRWLRRHLAADEPVRPSRGSSR